MVFGVVAVLIAGTMAVTAIAAAGEGAGTSPPSGEDFAPIAATADQAESPPEPTAAEVAASEEQHADLSDDEALDLAREHLDELISAQLFPELELAEDEAVGRYLGPYTAQIEREGPGPDAVVDSTLPMRAPEAGAQRPIDSDLEREGDHFEAENPIVNTEIPVELEDGIAIKPTGVSVEPLAEGNPDPVPVSDKLAYPNFETDTDLLVAPTPVGFEVAYQLRSPESPQRLPLDLELPPGASLELAPDDAARVVRGGERLLEIGAPKAWDAAEQPVDVHYELEGDRLIVVVPHRDRNYLMPIVVDPPFGYYDWEHGQTSRAFWWPYTTGPFSSFQSFDYAGNRAGLINRAPASAYYYPDQLGEFYAQSINTSFIERVDFYNFDQLDTPWAQPDACTVLAIWGNGWWTNGSAYNAQTGQTTNGVSWIDICGTLTHQTRSFWAGNSHYPDSRYGGDPEAAEGSMGVFALWAYQQGWRTQNAENVLRSANVWRYDWNDPVITSVSPTQGWIDDDVTPVQLAVSDPGLGVHALNLFGTGMTLWQNCGRNHAANPCAQACDGGHLKPCPANWTFQPRLPEGRTDVTAVAYDAQGRSSNAYSWTAKIDRQAPEITVPQWLRDAQGGAPLTDITYDLSVSAADPAPLSGGARSGLRSLTLSIDGEHEASSLDVPCPQENGCAASLEGMLATTDFSDGRHTIRATATDWADNSDTATFEITTAAPPQVEGVIESAIDSLEPYAAEQFPSHFGGMWINADETISIAFTENAQANVNQMASATNFPQPQRLRAVTVARSMNSLETLQDRMIDERAQVHGGALRPNPDWPDHYDLGVDEEANVVYAVVENSSLGIEAAFRDRYGTGIVVREGPLAVPEQGADPRCSRRDCRPVLRSGVASNRCTTAFAVRNNISGENGILTAAHCPGGPGDEVRHSGEVYGHVVRQVEGGDDERIDAQLNSVQDPPQGRFRVDGLIYVQRSERNREVRSQSTWRNLAKGSRVCKAGVTTGKTCGVIRDKRFSPDWLPGRPRRFIRTNYCGEPGDSGAGVFTQHRAFGVHSGGSAGPCDNNDFSVFSHIQYVQSRLDVTLLTR